ncbi:uncharacterized protein [Euwallacea fornicatus]|uniref:uncharacterized protein isoform X2 n=1 Tax=Euwallacea fornicatus TaxID=995702 RepID=UPI00338E550A
MLKLLRESIPKHPRKWKFLQSEVRYYARGFTVDHVQPLTEDTLTGRFLVYVTPTKNSHQATPLDKVNLIASFKCHRLNVKTADSSVISAMINALDDSNIVRNKYEFEDLFRALDSGCCSRINELAIEDHFNLLNAFTNVIGHKIRKSNYFLLALKVLTNQKNYLNKEQLVHLMFYIGLLKKDRIAQDMIRQCIKLFTKETINNLTKEDLCIICNSTFKTSTKIKNFLLLYRIKSYINNNLNLLSDPAGFVTFIKTLRHNRYQDEDILNTITCTMFFNETLQYYSFSAMCHILALYADFLFYDENVLNILTSKCLELLKGSTFTSKNTYLIDQPRTKDIKRLLWALSNLGYKLPQKDIDNIIMPQIKVRIKTGQFVNDQGSLVQMILYLWMMQYKARDLIREVLTVEVARDIWGNQIACIESLNLLLTCIYHEDPELFHQINLHPQQTLSSAYHQNIQLAKRPILQTIVDNLKSIAVRNGIDKYEVGCQVPFINIIGITGFQKKIYKTVNIEVLDEYTCLKNTENVPSGLMKLKLRILDGCDQGLIVV